jgi:uncharacterized protein (TIGR03435 family)
MPKVLFLATYLLSAQTLSFDIASIRPHPQDDDRFHVKMPSNGRFAAVGITAKLVLTLAYDVQESQIVGGPSWFATEKWDVEAKTTDQVAHSVEETHRMLQSLLGERFALRIHRQAEQRRAYMLVVGKGGPKFKASAQDGSTNYRITGNSISLERGDLARMAQFLATALGRPVIDRTGLGGRYDLSLLWDDAPIRQGDVPGLDAPAAAGDDRGSIFSAIQDQLGLRLEPQRTAVEVIVVDRIERPSQN